MTTEIWPTHAFGGTKRTVVNAEAQMMDEQETYRVIFHPSSGYPLTVQLPDTALRNLVETAVAAMGPPPKPKARRCQSG